MRFLTLGRPGIGSCDLPQLNLRFLETCDRGRTDQTKRITDLLTCIRSSKSPIRGTRDGRKMLDDALIEQLNRGYVCPPDAGPAWRAACEYGFDMSLVEESLRLTPEQRLERHQRALNTLLNLMEAKTVHATG